MGWGRSVGCCLILAIGALTALGLGAGAPGSPTDEPAPKESAPAGTGTPASQGAPVKDGAVSKEAAPRSAADRLLGAWRSDAASREKAFVVLVFDRIEGAPTQVRAWFPAAGVLGRPLDEAMVEADGTYRGTSTVHSLEITYSGAIDPTAPRLSLRLHGTAGGLQKGLDLTLEPTRLVDELPKITRYAGEVDAMGTKLPMGLALGDGGEFGWLGSVDVPAQRIAGLPVVVSRNGASLEITIPVGSAAARLTLTEQEGGAKLVGTFTQGPIEAPITFDRTTEALKGAARPQDPKPPFPYASRDVRIKSPEGHELAGTLTIPEGAAPERRVPGVVMLTGSGLQDRDESIAGHRPFLVIADAFARAGIAVLRCDDRGYDASTGDGAIATTNDFAADARVMMKFLREQPEIDPARCGYVGHSEGGITGPLAARDDQKAGSPVAFVVLLAAPSVRGRDLIPLQLRRVLAASGLSGETVDPIVLKQAALLDGVLASLPHDDLAALVLDVLNTQQAIMAKAMGMEVPEPMSAESPVIQQTILQLTSPWMRTFIALDPAPAISEVKAPIFALNGDLDTQVDTEQNLLLIEKIRKEAGLPVTVKRYSNLNHLFQPAKTGALDEYAKIDTTIDPAVLADLASWITDTAAAAAPAPASTPGK